MFSPPPHGFFPANRRAARMQRNDEPQDERRPYRRPRLVVHGTLLDVTLASTTRNKNDPAQGGRTRT